jgi:hypothetical protein
MLQPSIVGPGQSNTRLSTGISKTRIPKERQTPVRKASVRPNQGYNKKELLILNSITFHCSESMHAIPGAIEISKRADADYEDWKHKLPNPLGRMRFRSRRKFTEFMFKLVGRLRRIYSYNWCVLRIH